MIDERGAEGIAGGENNAQVDRSTPQPVSEHSLTTDVLQHALAFRGNSGEIFNAAVADVRTLTSDGSPVYPPDGLFSGVPGTGMGLQSEQGHFTGAAGVGPLSPAEAVGVKVLSDEFLAFHNMGEMTDQLEDKLRLIFGTGGSYTDSIDGIWNFIKKIAIASGIRKELMTGKRIPIIGFETPEGYDALRSALEQDALKIGVNTANAAVDRVGVSRFETDDVLAGKIKGAKLARDLYLETVDHAAKILPETI